MAFACLNMRREEAFSEEEAIACSADVTRTARMATKDKAARRVLTLLTNIVFVDNSFFTISIDGSKALDQLITD